MYMPDTYHMNTQYVYMCIYTRTCTVTQNA